MKSNDAGTAAASENTLRREICDIGARLYTRGFAAGNDGNISFRIAPDRVLCTPTLVCKGFMEPKDLAVVDLDGNQLSGRRRRTSEIMLHLEVYKGVKDARAVVHCHPPHATAFAIARVDIPSGILPEVELFLGVVPRAEYETPGGTNFAATIRPFLGGANTVVLSNHGTVSWGPTVEQAFWNTEILDSYCRMLLLAAQLGHVERLSAEKVRDLLALRPLFGIAPDPRAGGIGDMFTNPTFGMRK
jgi:L-fuculose-phosphate aldolase